MFLGIDIGSTSIKGAVLDPAAGTVSHITKEAFPEPLLGMPPGCFEIDPLAVLDGVRCVIGQLLPFAPECRGIVSCGQMGGVILADSRRSPLTNYLSWRDQRATVSTSRHAESLYSCLLRQISHDDLLTIGRELKPGSMTVLLAWLREHDQLPNHGVPLMLGDFVMSHLTESRTALDFTAATGLLDLRTRTWHYGLFEQLRIGELAWPSLQSWQQPVGELRHNGRAIPVYPCVGDHPCALAGVGLAEGELSINISTGSQVALLTATWRPGDYQTRCALDERYINTITHIPAGRSLNVLVDLLTELATVEGVTLTKSWDYVTQAAASAPDEGLAVNLAFFAGPLGDRGVIDGITTENLRVGPLFRAAFRSMADNYAELAKRVSHAQDWKSIVLSGGLAQGVPLLREFLAERFSVPQRLSSSTEDTLLGLLAMTHVLAGHAPSIAASCVHFRRQPATAANVE